MGDMKKQRGIYEGIVIVMIPNRLLEQTIWELMIPFECTIVQALNERAVNRILRHSPQAILLADLYAIKQNFRLFMRNLTETYPTVPVVLLLPSDTLPLFGVESFGEMLLQVEIDKAKEQLLPALERARDTAHHAQMLSAKKKDEKTEIGTDQKAECLFEQKFTRRSFLKGSAAVAASFAVSGGLKRLSHTTTSATVSDAHNTSTESS